MNKTHPPPPTFPPHLTAAEREKNDDYEWALHDPEVRRRYAGKIVVVHRKQVLGAGKTFRAAWAAARRRRRCPAKREVAMAVVPYPNAAGPSDH
jgi:hypothetical protein